MKRNNHYYTVFPFLSGELGLSGATKETLAYIISVGAIHKNYKVIGVSYSEIQAAVGISRATAISAVKRLQSLELLAKTNTGRCTTSAYTLSEQVVQLIYQYGAKIRLAASKRTIPATSIVSGIHNKDNNKESVKKAIMYFPKGEEKGQRSRNSSPALVQHALPEKFEGSSTI